MPKRRSAAAVAAWSRHQGAHDPGSRKPDVDETEEGLEEYNDEEEEGRDGEGSEQNSGGD